VVEHCVEQTFGDIVLEQSVQVLCIYRRMPDEGINNKIKVIKRIAYGFRDDAYFFLKIRAAFPGKP
jgi:hypothetical protein